MESKNFKALNQLLALLKTLSLYFQIPSLLCFLWFLACQIAEFARIFFSIQILTDIVRVEELQGPVAPEQMSLDNLKGKVVDETIQCNVVVGC